jgi:membrane protein GlpM
MDLLLKAIVGAAMVVVIQLVARSSRPYLAGLVPLFPTFTLISHYLVGTQRTVGDLKATIRFGMISLFPYCAYMGVLYLVVEHLPLPLALAIATMSWLGAAFILIRLFPAG